MLAIALSILSFQLTLTDISWTQQPAPSPKGAMAVHLTTDGADLIMSWLEPSSKHAGKFMVARMQGGQWQPPTVIHESDRLFINWADIPKVLVSETLAVAVWPEMIGEDTYAYGLRYRISADGGRTWSAPEPLHEDQQPKEHGFVSLAFVNQNTIGAIWLDGRAMGEGHDGPGSMQLRYRELTAAGAGPEVLLDEMTCECCGTDLVMIQGQPAAIYRNRSQAHIRDIKTLHRNPAGDWRESSNFPSDQWLIHGCPVNGPAIIHQSTQTAAAWFTMAENQPKIRFASKGAADKAWRDWGRFGNTPLGRVALSFLSEHAILVTWLESGEDTEQIFFAVFDLNHPDQAIIPPTPLDATGKGRSAGFPKLATIGKTCYIAYQDPAQPGIKIQKTLWQPRQK